MKEKEYKMSDLFDIPPIKSPVIKSIDGNHIGLGHCVGLGGVTKIEECLLHINQPPVYVVWAGEEVKCKIVGFPVIITYFMKEELEGKSKDKK